jgi:hypothetical protein
MMMKTTLQTLICLASGSLALVACKKDTATTPPAAGDVAAKPAAGDSPPASAAAIPANLPAAFAAWDLPARAQAWQGAWVSEQSLGFAEAFMIAGTTATSWDGKVEKKLGFALESPCSARFSESSGGGTSSTTTHFTLVGGKLVEGLGDAGSRKGKTAIACVSDQILTLDEAGACTAWEMHFERWESTPATCALVQKDGKDAFTAKVHDADYSLIADGDALLSDQLAHKSSAAFTDFAAAKAARDAKK